MTFLKGTFSHQRKQPPISLEFLNTEQSEEVLRYHQSFPPYEKTPLVELSHLAQYFGVNEVYIKDESYRFGLNAFKVLGGSYGMGMAIAEKVGIPKEEMTFDRLCSKEVKEKLGSVTFVTATDGNHGRGVAWTARQLGQKAVVYMPKGSAVERLKNIQAEGAEAFILEMNYDEAVRYSEEQAQKNNWIVVQDTAWEGYEKIPTWIMQGYATMAYESYQQLQGRKPTHIFLQAGVGSMAGAVCGFFASLYGENRPKVIVMEPDTVDCLYQTALVDDGGLHSVQGDFQTIMVGLACGEPNRIAWEILRDYGEGFITCSDSIAATGMRILGNPLLGDQKVISGESGAVGIGVLVELMTNPLYQEMKEKIGLNSKSKVLFFSTEGDTDQKNYRDIVWHGKYPLRD